MQKNQTFSLLLTTALFLTACSNSFEQNEIKGAGFLDGLYTTRPSVEEPSLAVLKLSTPALLETATRKNGSLTIDAKQLKAIQDEQAATIDALTKISSDVRVLIRYRLVLNGLAVWAPADVLEKIKTLPNVTMSEQSAPFARPALAVEAYKAIVGDRTSVKFIGSEKAYAENIRGEGMRVGVIDTGVDYTHKMFGGEGTPEAYKAVDPSSNTAAFPNKKVVGGIDLVGTKFNSASPRWQDRIPSPDANPLDEASHGTHVAGTVAGLGDGMNTYDGVAPAASLYAIKVFGAKGSTSDEVVIAALEYAADPTGDLTFKEQLDVVNLSLGSGYGNPHIMYNQAIKNLVRGGTLVVASGGNSGDKKFIVGAPGVSDDAISVASNIDNMNQNIQFQQISFESSGTTVVQSEISEAAITRPLNEFTSAQGEVVYAGLGDQEFSDELKAQIKGRVAFLERGGVNFSVKINKSLAAGAVAVVVANNTDEDPSPMGGDGKDLPIPAVMITKKAGAVLKAALAIGQTVTVDLKNQSVLEKPWLIDTISPFSSRGPRSEDGLIKPEIAAPGTNIISAGVGTGFHGVALSGTSMAGPHIAGVMALLKQKYPNLTSPELKSVLLGQGKVIADKDKKQYPVARQGAGRVQVNKSIDAKVVTVPATLSFGLQDIEKQKSMVQEITIKNISNATVTLTPQWQGSAALQIQAPPVTLAAGEEKKIRVKATLQASLLPSANEEADGFLMFQQGDETVVKLPALAVVRKISNIRAEKLVVQSSSPQDAAGSYAELSITNQGVNPGPAYLFNLIGKDSRKKDPRPDLVHNKNCDLQSAGYRLIRKEGATILQVAMKLYEGMTTWNKCEVNVQIDADKDGVTDQELAGLPLSNLPGLSGDQFASLLLDGTKARKLRLAYEAEYAKDPAKAQENYAAAAIDARPMQIFDNSTLAIIEADVQALAISDTGELNIKISTTHQDSGAVEYDDYLDQHEKEWHALSSGSQGAAYTNLPEAVLISPQESTILTLQKGYGRESLVLYLPQNRAVRDPVLEDSQSQVIEPQYTK